jgi:hypothetical protein
MSESGQDEPKSPVTALRAEDLSTPPLKIESPALPAQSETLARNSRRSTTGSRRFSPAVTGNDSSCK